ncbi:MAG: glycoside hydrolase 15-like protein, partial [Symbiobacteriaceae bacterium]|nr:glycoside hydrolase 15-like protein [Symbiobacteriaceae bacterium]
MSNGKPYFGAVGNGETVALVGPDAAVAWLCAPRPDSFPVFARALDPEKGGRLSLHFRWGGRTLTEADQADQRYLARTNILITSLLLDDLSVTVLDYMPWGRRHLTRLIKLDNLGEERRGVRVGFSIRPTASAHAPEDLRDRVYAAFKGPEMALLSPGESVTTTLVLAYGETPTEALRNWSEAQAGTPDLDREQNFWNNWLAPARP